MYTSSEGVVTSPGFPSPYNHESECVWTITVPAGDTITLTFTTIDIEFANSCDYDFVEVTEISNYLKKLWKRAIILQHENVNHLTATWIFIFIISHSWVMYILIWKLWKEIVLICQIRDGPDETSPLFNRFCGTTLPAPLTSTGNTMFIRFSSDHSQTGQGFRATWTTGKTLTRSNPETLATNTLTMHPSK